MHFFSYKKDELYCEDVRLSDLAERFGTPLYVYSQRTILDHYGKLKKAFASLKPLICFSVKSNSNLSILRLLVRNGSGLDIVSGGELYRALKAGVASERIVYAGVGKTRKEILDSLRAGILFFNVESLQELSLISEVATGLGKTARVCLRINPHVDPHTHRYITTGTIESKFGIDIEMARIIFFNRKNFRGVSLEGVHVHIGSQITQAAPFLAALRRILGFIDELKAKDIRVKWLNIGGGLGIIYKNEEPQTADAFARSVVPLLKKSGLNIILEPGRFIVGNAGVLLTRVIFVKDASAKRFVIADAGMNDLVRPSLYEAFHEIWPLHRGDRVRKTELKRADVVGPICESGDFLAKDRFLPLYEPGKILALMSAGAYGFSMSSNYNSRRRAAEVLVCGDRFELIRRREGLRDLSRGERIVEL